jgi:hypothetical protein
MSYAESSYVRHYYIKVHSIMLGAIMLSLWSVLVCWLSQFIRYTECNYTVILLNILILSADTLRVIMANVNWLNVVTP